MRPLTRLDTALLRTIERLGLEPALREGRALGLWAEVVGAQVAEATRAENVRDGVLWVVTRSSTWAFELSFHKERILRELNARLGRGTVRDLRFRVGSLEQPGGEPLPEPLPDPETLAAVTLPEEVAASIEAAVASQTDPELRARIAAVLTTDRRRSQWLAGHGYRSCVRCGTLHRRATAECPACRQDARPPSAEDRQG